MVNNVRMFWSLEEKMLRITIKNKQYHRTKAAAFVSFDGPAFRSMFSLKFNAPILHMYYTVRFFRKMLIVGHKYNGALRGDHADKQVRYHFPVA